jgi:hypothetical protein
MADENKTILRGIIEFGAGTLAAVGVEAALKAAKEHIGVAAEAKAKELFIDSGDRAKTFAEVAKLAISNNPAKKAAGNKVRGFIVEAQGEHEEGELTNLLKKVSDGDKSVVLQMLGSLDSYEEFTATVRSFLAHDNFFQEVMKLAKRAEATGGTIVSDDVRTIWRATTATINNFAGAARPGIRNLTDTLRRVR